MILRPLGATWTITDILGPHQDSFAWVRGIGPAPSAGAALFPVAALGCPLAAAT